MLASRTSQSIMVAAPPPKGKSLTRGNPLYREIPYTWKSRIQGNPLKGNPLYREVPRKGKSHAKGNPLYRGIPYTVLGNSVAPARPIRSGERARGPQLPYCVITITSTSTITITITITYVYNYYYYY